MNLKLLITSIGLGAGLMYFLDPQQGSRRRAMVRDKTNKLVNDIDDSITVGLEDVRNRVRGTLAEMTARFSDQGAPDWILEERVRTRLGRMARHARGVDVRADGGRVYLSGPVLREDVEDIVKVASRTPGVHSVQNELQTFETPQDIPALQGTPSARRRALPEWQQENWSPAARLLSGVGGSLLTLFAMKQRGLMKPVLSTVGLALTTRGLTNFDTRSLLGAGEKAIRAHKAININAPVDVVYQFWRNFQNFPLFMEHVKEITSQNGAWHWKVKGPADTTIEFDSYITEDVPNSYISWETQPDSQVRHHGFVRFDENRDGSTRVTVQMQYVPPAGAVGHAVAQLFGVDPRQAMQDDLIRLKSLLEVGQTSSEDRTVSFRTRNQGQNKGSLNNPV